MSVVYKIDRLSRARPTSRDGRGVRPPRRVLRLGHAAVQHHDLDGAADVNILLSFVQFEREVTGDASATRLRPASARDVMGGPPRWATSVVERKLIVVDTEVALVAHLRRLRDHWLDQ